jgi:hypothetical protein
MKRLRLRSSAFQGFPSTSPLIIGEVAQLDHRRSATGQGDDEPSVPSSSGKLLNRVCRFPSWSRSSATDANQPTFSPLIIGEVAQRADDELLKPWFDQINSSVPSSSGKSLNASWSFQEKGPGGVVIILQSPHHRGSRSTLADGQRRLVHSPSVPSSSGKSLNSAKDGVGPQHLSFSPLIIGEVAQRRGEVHRPGVPSVPSSSGKSLNGRLPARW